MNNTPGSEMKSRITIKTRHLIFFKPPIEQLSLPSSLIIAASAQGDLETIMTLSKSTSEMDLCDALWVAAGYRQISIVKFLLEKNINPNVQSSFCLQHRYPLQIAISTPDNYACLLLLLDHDADLDVKTISGKSIWELTTNHTNLNLINAYINFYKAIEEFSSNLLQANLAFTSALQLDPRFVFDRLAIMVEASNAVETNLGDNDNYHPEFLKFAIRHLILLAETKPELFTKGWLSDEFMNLSMHLNAYDTADAEDNPYALFRSKEEKMKMLYYFELNSALGDSKKRYKDAFKPQ